MVPNSLPVLAVEVAGAPDVPGLAFRHFQGEQDYPAMVAIFDGSREIDGLESTRTVDDVARLYENRVNCDPSQDLLFADVDGDPVGYSITEWIAGPRDQRYYRHYTYLLPGWRGKGIRRAMLRHSEDRLVELAAMHTEAGLRWFETYARSSEHHWANLVLTEGYRATQYSFQMVRHHLTEVPDPPMPEGLDVRQVRPEDTFAVWLAAKEAYQEEWWYTEELWSDSRYETWRQDRTFDPSLWQVAWDEDQVAGMVLNYIDAEENNEYGRQRGYTETICVRLPWRRRGLARALLARSLRMLHGMGLSEAALNVDADNPSRALELYREMGFTVDKQTAFYRKALGEQETRSPDERAPLRREGR